MDQVHPTGTRYTLPDQVHLPWTRYTPRAVHAGRYGQQAGGTHPTGMNSCCELFLANRSTGVDTDVTSLGYLLRRHRRQAHLHYTRNPVPK